MAENSYLENAESVLFSMLLRQDSLLNVDDLSPRPLPAAPGAPARSIGR